LKPSVVVVSLGQDRFSNNGSGGLGTACHHPRSSEYDTLKDFFELGFRDFRHHTLTLHQPIATSPTRSTTHSPFPSSLLLLAPPLPNDGSGTITRREGTICVSLWSSKHPTNSNARRPNITPNPVSPPKLEEYENTRIRETRIRTNKRSFRSEPFSFAPPSPFVRFPWSWWCCFSSTSLPFSRPRLFG
jgi:hypothetical protein